jgi:hypothetical protein
VKVIKVEYETEYAARAFMHGVEFGRNDNYSAHEPRQEGPKKWVVYVHDWSAELEEDACPACVDSMEQLHGQQAARDFEKLLSDEARARAEDADLGS